MIYDTFDYVQQQAERQIQEFFHLMQLGQVDLGAVFGCSIQLLVTVSVCQPHHLGKKWIYTSDATFLGLSITNQ